MSVLLAFFVMLSVHFCSKVSNHTQCHVFGTSHCDLQLSFAKPTNELSQALPKTDLYIIKPKKKCYSTHPSLEN